MRERTLIPGFAWWNPAGIIYFCLPFRGESFRNFNPDTYRMRRFAVTRNGLAICGGRRFS